MYRVTHQYFVFLKRNIFFNQSPMLLIFYDFFYFDT